MMLSANITILIIILCTAACSLIGYVIYRMFYLDSGPTTAATSEMSSGTMGMHTSNEQKQYMKRVRERYREDIDDLDAGFDRYEMPPKQGRFCQSVETFDSYESERGREDLEEYDLRSPPKGRFPGRNGGDDWF